MDTWPFSDPPNVAAITTKQIIRDGHAVLLVVHDEEDGGWQFLHGGAFAVEDGMVVALKTVIHLDPTLAELADLPLGWEATRKDKTQPWSRRKVVEDGL